MDTTEQELTPEQIEDPRRQEWLDGMFAVLEFYRTHPELIPTTGHEFLDFSSVADEKARCIAYARALGQADKDYSGSVFRVSSKPGAFGPHHVVYVATKSAVCTRTIETVEKEVTGPDPDAVAALPEVTRTITEEVVTWECPPSLLADG